MSKRIKYILIKEFIQMLRDPKMRVVMFVVPVVQTLLFSFAASTDVKNVPLAVYDLDNTFASRELAREFVYSKYFTVKEYLNDDAREKFLIDKGAVSTVLRINRGFSADVASGKGACAQLIIDGTDSNTASIIMSYASKISQRYSLKISPLEISYSGPFGEPLVETRLRSWFNENLDSSNYLVPGVIALVVMIVTFLSTAMAVVREKESGTIEQLIVSPIRPLELIIGKILPFALVGIVDVFVVVAVAVAVFHIPVRGNLFLLAFSSCLFILNTLGLGLFVSTRSNTQQEALMSMFFFAQPMVLLSGFVFPIANMPAFAQIITLVNPLRYYLVIIRGIFLKGSGLGVLWPHMAALLLMGILIVLLSSMCFRNKLG